jgi:hypothetical protein
MVHHFVVGYLLLFPVPRLLALSLHSFLQRLRVEIIQTLPTTIIIAKNKCIIVDVP